MGSDFFIACNLAYPSWAPVGGSAKTKARLKEEYFNNLDDLQLMLIFKF